MEEDENKEKEYNDQENEETPEENPQKIISMDNADFTKKSQTLNSPRSLEACLHLGIEPSELYKLNKEEFKKKYPEVKKLDQDLFDYRYEAEENFRNKTIEDVKKERDRIIEEENKNKENQDSNQNKKNEKIESEQRWDKIIENEKKSIEKIKKKQRQNIETLIEEQINKELIIKVT